MNARGPVIDFPSSSCSPTKTAAAPLPPSSKTETLIVAFNRQELALILSRYGMMVAAGHWRDYAIDMQQSCAIFSIYRHTSERALYRLEKHPKLAAKQGAFLARNQRGVVLKRGRVLSQVLKVFDKRLELVKG